MNKKGIVSPQIDPHRMREVRCPSDPQSTCKSTFEGRKGAACVARLSPSPSFSLIPQSRLPRPITENPSIPPSLLPLHRRPPLPQHPTVRTAALVGRSLARLVGRPVPLWTSIHPVHAEKRRGRGRARVFTELTWTYCVQAKPESTFALSTLIHLFWYSFFKLQHAH